MSNSGSCSLLIRGDNLDFNEIEENLQIKPSRIIRKGEIYSKVIGKNQYDIWILDIKFDNNGTPEDALMNLASIIHPFKEYVKKLSMVADVRIKCYVQSEYAQLNFELSSRVISELADLNVKVEISILSWGAVKNE